MRILPVIDRISDQCSIFFNTGPAFGIVDLENYTGPKPSAFVLAVEDEPSANAQDIGVSQRIETYIGVLIVAPNIDLDEQTEYLEMARDQIFDALLGWEYADNDPLEYVSGQIVTQTHTLVWWQDIFVSRTYRRSK